MPIRFVTIKPRPATAGIATAPRPQALVLNTRGPAVTSAPLAAGTAYTVTVTGTYTLWNVPLTYGHPEPDAMFPTSGGSRRASTQVGLDAETIFAANRNVALGESPQFLIGGIHREPVGGPITSPVAGHRYTYTLTGTGSPVTFTLKDIQGGAAGDNYGALHITITPSD